MESRLKRTKKHHKRDNLLALIPHNKRSEKLIEALAALDTAGFRFPSYKQLYLDVIENARFSYNLKRCFQTLTDADLSGNRYKQLYTEVIAHADNAYQLIEAFNDLHAAGLWGANAQELYMLTVARAPYAYTAAYAFRALHSAKLSGEENMNMYFTVLQKAKGDCSEIILMIETLNHIELSAQHKDIYKEAINQSHDAFKLSPALYHMKTLGFSIEDDLDLYVHVIKHSHVSNIITQAFEELLAAGYTWRDNKDTYLKVINESTSSAKHAFHIVSALQTLNSNNQLQSCRTEMLNQVIETPLLAKELTDNEDLNDNVWFALNYYEIFSRAKSKNSPLVVLIFTELGKVNISPKKHEALFETILQQIIDGNSIRAVKILNEACRVAAECEGNPSQEALNSVIEKTLNPRIHYGPLVKSYATHQFEALLTRIAQAKKTHEIVMSFDENNGYSITVGSEDPINVTLLLQYANLSHLTLSDQTIQQLDKIIQQLTPDEFFENDNDVLATLTPGSRNAIERYTDQRYKNMNRLFRGEELISKSDYAWVTPVHCSNSYLANFLCGCLINDAANKLEPLKNKRSSDPAQAGEAKRVHLDPELSRGEKVNTELKKRRLANVMRAPSVTSFSHFKGGSQYFHREGTVQTKLKGDFKNYPVINPHEGEIVFAHGEQIQYHRAYNGGFYAELVRSPDHERQEGYIAGLALQQAFSHLRRPYSESDNHTIVRGTRIERPNHGLAHTYRVMMNIVHVINYFSVHAIDDEFKEFCLNISLAEKELLCAAAAFSITGRESEIAAVEDLERYDSYRESSAVHFLKFLDSLISTSIKNNRSMNRRLLHIVRYMGNPWYEKAAPDGSRQQINDHPNHAERQHRNFLHRILTIAHKLDLPRCYSKDEFNASMAMCRSLSDETLTTSADRANSDYMKLIQYTIELTKAHGNMLQFDVTADGTFTDQSYRYQAPFDDASTSLKRLFEISETVPLSIASFTTQPEHKRLKL